ncbi:MAG: manganese-binding transcriptional regulator MntR [Planctomycetota bacterium]
MGKPASNPAGPTASPPTAPQTAGFRRTREDHARETAEDYVEAIAQLADDDGQCRVRDLAARLGVSHVTVIRVVNRLTEQGLVSTEPYKPLRLTKRGQRLAEACAERHAAVVAFLLKLGVDERTAAIDAEGIEHHLSEATLRAMRAFTRG